MKWLVREEAYFEKSPASSSGKGMETARSTFGEMLLLMAIHFHSGQLSAVCDLVCSTLGMRLLLRPASTARMKLAFTQDIFPEQVGYHVRLFLSSNLIKPNCTLGCYFSCCSGTCNARFERRHCRFSSRPLHLPIVKESSF